jgi:uncharacterized protein
MNARQHKLIESYAMEQMSKLGLHGWPHVKRVVRLSLRLAKTVECADYDVVEAAALLHDVAKHLERNGKTSDHGKLSAEMAEEFLKSAGFGTGKIESICHAIRAQTHGEEAKSVEARILHDADLLDKMGTVGVATYFIRACLTETTIEEALKSWNKPLKGSCMGVHALWLQKPDFHLQTARNIAEDRNKIVYEFFEQLEDEIQLEDI